MSQVPKTLWQEKLLYRFNCVRSLQILYGIVSCVSFTLICGCVRPHSKPKADTTNRPDPDLHPGILWFSEVPDRGCTLSKIDTAEFLTARHCTEEEGELRYKQGAKMRISNWKKKEVYEAFSAFYTQEVTVRAVLFPPDPQRDVAVIRVEELTPDIPIRQLARERPTPNKLVKLFGLGSERNGLGTTLLPYIPRLGLINSKIILSTPQMPQSHRTSEEDDIRPLDLDNEFFTEARHTKEIDPTGDKPSDAEVPEGELARGDSGGPAEDEAGNIIGIHKDIKLLLDVPNNKYRVYVHRHERVDLESATGQWLSGLLEQWKTERASHGQRALPSSPKIPLGLHCRTFRKGNWLRYWGDLRRNGSEWSLIVYTPEKGFSSEFAQFRIVQAGLSGKRYGGWESPPFSDFKTILLESPDKKTYGRLQWNKRSKFKDNVSPSLVVLGDKSISISEPDCHTDFPFKFDETLAPNSNVDFYNYSHDELFLPDYERLTIQFQGGTCHLLTTSNEHGGDDRFYHCDKPTLDIQLHPQSAGLRVWWEGESRDNQTYFSFRSEKPSNPLIAKKKVR